ncbi:hypothetical protein AB0L53_57710 [Nonomuraea sp. NPDC052129]|uniref:hypothetical protein n=1 Tax=Nonomuraea sp. NPDC052129 TaxID=3154651 RepID=UPI00341F4099
MVKTDAGMAELAEAFEAANLDELPADRAITRIIAVFLRNGAKYAAVIRQADDFCDPAAVERASRPIREVIARGIRDKVLAADLREDVVFAMFSAIVERALWLTVGEVTTPEEATEAAVTIFLNGARVYGSRAEDPGSSYDGSGGRVLEEGCNASVSRAK